MSSSQPSASAETEAPEPALVCRGCGLPHAFVPLARGDKAVCSRCGTLLAKRGRLGPHAPLAFALAGAILALAALALPFIVVSKFGRVRTTWLFSGGSELWSEGMPLLATWVFLCGILAPVILCGTLAALLSSPRARLRDRDARRLFRLVHALAHWAMPEVHVLAVLVALIKLGTLVNVAIGPGFWCYTAMAVVLLVAARGLELDANRAGPFPRPRPHAA